MEKKMAHILIIDDDKKLQDLLTKYLQEAGYSTGSRYDGLEAARALNEENPDIIILDVMMPGRDGFDVLRDIRKVSSVPVVMLTARGEEMDRIIGLEVGADDYLPKPFNPRELLARIRAILRRSGEKTRHIREDALLCLGNLILDCHRQLLSCGEESLSLSATEFRIMELLMNSPGRIYTREEIMDHARGRDFIAFERSIDVHISRLRGRLEKFSACGVEIRTAWGRGYSCREVS